MAKKRDVLFICYSHTDSVYKKRFDKFLQGGALETSMDIFSDADIKPGEEWQEQIIGALGKATAALVLVSQDFMISPFIQEVELRNLLTSRLQDGLRLFLVPVRSTYYQGTYLETFQWARPPDKPLSLLPEVEQEKAMVEVVQVISKELEKRVDEELIKHTIECVEKVPRLDLPPIYEMEGFAGEGEFARCYFAKDRSLDRRVIIKVLYEELSRDSPAFDRYVRSASRLNHRNIAGVFFSQTNKRPHFIVTPGISGKTLKEHLETDRVTDRPTLKDSIHWTVRIAKALHYAHMHDCVHGRLRPEEVRFDGEDQPILAGFRTLAADGSAKAYPGKVHLDDIWYASPETRRDGSINAKTDQYLLGMLAYEMIAGRKPVDVSTWASLLDPQVASFINNPRPLKDMVASCPEQISTVIMKALAPAPEDRWRDLQEMVQELLSGNSSRGSYEAARASYRKCAQSQAFYETVYAKLFEFMPGAETLFKSVSLQRQYEVLRDAIWLLLKFPDSRDADEPTILSGVARTHKDRTEEDYDHFRNAILAAVQLHDSASVVKDWEVAMAPGFEYLKSKASKERAAGVSAS